MTSLVRGRSSVFGQMIKQFVRNEDGATAIEYSLIVALIFLAIVGAVKEFRNSTSEMYSEISDAVTNG